MTRRALTRTSEHILVTWSFKRQRSQLVQSAWQPLIQVGQSRCNHRAPPDGAAVWPACMLTADPGPAALIYIFHTWFRPLIESMTSQDAQLKTTLSAYRLSESVYLALRNWLQVRHRLFLVFQVILAAADMSAGRAAAVLLLLSCCILFVPSCTGHGKLTWWHFTLCINQIPFNEVLI